MDPRRAQIAQAILDLSAGALFDSAVLAQCDALATAIGATYHLNGRSLAEAEEFVRDLVDDMVGNIKHHWGTIEMTGHGRAGEA